MINKTYLINRLKTNIRIIFLIGIIFSIQSGYYLTVYNEFNINSLSSVMQVLSLIIAFLLIVLPIYANKNLFVKKEAEKIFALPIHRKALWFTNNVAGLLYILIPFTLVFVIICAISVVTFNISVILLVCLYLVFVVSTVSIWGLHTWIIMKATTMIDAIIYLIGFTLINICAMQVIASFIQNMSFIYYYDLNEYNLLFSPLGVIFNYVGRAIDDIYVSDTRMVFKQLYYSVVVLILIVSIIAWFDCIRLSSKIKVENIGKQAKKNAIHVILITGVTIGVFVLFNNLWTIELIECIYPLTVYLILWMIVERKLKITMKQVIGFIVICICLNILTFTYKQTQAFGLEKINIMDDFDVQFAYNTIQESYFYAVNDKNEIRKILEEKVIESKNEFYRGNYEIKGNYSGLKDNQLYVYADRINTIINFKTNNERNEFIQKAIG